MTTGQIWQQVLAHLQSDLPRAAFETWVRDTQALSLEGDLLTVRAQNAYARDWLEVRLTAPIQDWLNDHLGRAVTVRFVSGAETEEPEEEEPQLSIEPVAWLDYDRIVQPHRQVVVKGYLRRLGREIGPKAVWLYIGFHQAAWRRQDQKGNEGQPLHSREVLRFSALSHGAFWRLLKDATIQKCLDGLVQRVDPIGYRRFRRGRDGRPHQAPIRYQVHMTPRLTRMDSAAIQSHLQGRLAEGSTLDQALQELLVMDLGSLLDSTGFTPQAMPLNTVMDIVRVAAGPAYSADLDSLAQSLHRRVIDSLGDIHIPHFFITRTIPAFGLTPAQAWLITVARDMAFVNARTGERRERVTFRGGYREMAELAGSNRYKTVQAWLHPQWTTQQRGGDLARFLQEVDVPDSGLDLDLRVDSMPRVFRVLLDEPLDADGSHTPDADGTHMADADGSISWTQMGALADANGSHMVDANGSDLNSFKHPLNTDKKNTSTTQHAQSATTAEAVAPDFWELETLLAQNEVHPKVQKELLEVQASVHAFVSWVLYVASPKSGNLSDPLGYALSRLRENPLREARGIFRQLADLPPAELLELIDATPKQGYALPIPIHHALAPAWNKVMGAGNSRLPIVRAILFGEGACEPS